VDCGTDRTGESPLREGAGAGRRGVTPGGADKKPRVGGVILANVGIDEAREIMKKDPFTIHGAAEYQFIEFTPGKCDERFLCFVRYAKGADS